MKQHKTINYFGKTMWIVTFEKRGGGFGCMSYGVCGVFNTPQKARKMMDSLNATQAAQPASQAWHSMVKYDVKSIDLTPTALTTELFHYHY